MNTLLKSILNIQSTSKNQVKMQEFILNKYPEAVQDKAGNIYITKGKADTYPCVVAHLDTVHEIIKDKHYHVVEADNQVFAIDTSIMDFTGIGGDDKCGIYVALHCLDKLDNIKVAFFVDEEIGCVGSNQANMDFFNDVGYAIQCDRTGYEDVVTDIFRTSLCSETFKGSIKPLLKEYGKSFCDNGGMTDVYQLVENGLEVSCLNLSCGYYRPHCPDEFIDLKDLYDTRDFVVDIIKLLGEEVYKNEKKRSKSWSRLYKDNVDYNDISQDNSCPRCKRYNTYPDEFSCELYCFDCQDYTGSLSQDITEIADPYQEEKEYKVFKEAAYKISKKEGYSIEEGSNLDEAYMFYLIIMEEEPLGNIHTWTEAALSEVYLQGLFRS